MRRFLLCCVLGLGASLGVSADEARQTEQQLERLRADLKTLRESLEKDLGERDRLRQSLTQAEREIAQTQGSIQRLKEQQNESRNRLAQLEQKLQDQRLRVKDQSRGLSAQLRSAYINGRQPTLKLILNSEDPISLARNMTYYGFLSRQRSEQIMSLRKDIKETQRLEAEVEKTLGRQEQLTQETANQLKILEQAQTRRRQTLSAIENRITEQDSQVKRLTEEEQALIQLLAELKDLLAEYPVQTEEAFASLKGQLQWPTAGRLLHDFGQPRAARIPWRGVVIGAPTGKPVRAIARGRVSYADWLPGMGLLLILDHGGGFMSLYGYNQTLSKAVGDWVSPGDTVARIGDTGGQTEPSLYFEIRQSGKPMNPHKWFKSAIPKNRP